MKTHDFPTGHRMPVLGLGTWQSEPGEVGAAVEEAIRLGYRHVDCSPIYYNEPEIGAALAASLADGSVSREDVWITSKLWNNAHAAGAVRPALEETLNDLRLEHLDLYLMHWPVAIRPDIDFPESGGDMISLDVYPLRETWQAMEEVVDAGLARHIGVSNCSATKVQAICDGARIRPAANQVELHPYLRQEALIAACRRLGVFVTAYAPLGSRARPERLKSDDEPVLLQDPVILDIASRLECTPAQVLIAWAIERGTSVIPKSVHPGRLSENLAAAEIILDADAVREIDRLDRGRRYISGGFWAQGDSPYTMASLWDEEEG